MAVLLVTATAAGLTAAVFVVLVGVGALAAALTAVGLLGCLGLLVTVLADVNVLGHRKARAAGVLARFLGVGAVVLVGMLGC